jgi:hypothetical protein
MIEGVDYFIRLVNLPCGVGGMVTPNEDGTFSIYLNARETHETNMKKADHEVGHILHDDFYNDKTIEEVES